MQPEGESPASLKLLALQKVVNSDLSDGDKLFLVEFMNTYAPTGELFDPREEIMEKLVTIEMTWGERLRAQGREEGREEGLEKGLEAGRTAGEQKMLLHLLTLMFGEVPAALVARINALTDEAMLAMVAQQILTIKRLEELVLPQADSPQALG